jgi:hypothetical protein
VLGQFACRLAHLSLPKTVSEGLAVGSESEHDRCMIAIGLLFIRMPCDYFKPRQQLEAEILALRHQPQRAPRQRLHLRWVERALFIWLYRRYPRILDAICIIRPETILRWLEEALPPTGDGSLVHPGAGRGSLKRCAT